MNLSTILYYLFAIASIAYILHLGFYLIGASLYDIRLRGRTNARSAGRGYIDYRPHVTVLVPAHNEEKVIVRCLTSIYNSTYKNIDVIVANDASNDETRRILWEYVRQYPDRKLRIINKRINVGKGGALNYALRRYATGELIMTLDADSVIDSHAIENATRYFIDPRVAGVAANVQIMNEHTVLSVLQKFEHMIGYRSKKAYSITNCEFVIGGVASTYRMDVMRKVGFYDTDTLTEDIGLSMKVVARGNKAHRIVYGADIMALTEPVESLRALFRQRFRWKYGSLQNLLKHSNLIENGNPQFSMMLTMYRLPMAVVTEIALLLLPLMWMYALYLTFTENSLLLILGAYTTVTIYAFVTLWYDEHLPWLERLYLSIYVPVAYFIFYIMDVIQVLAIIKCLFKARALGRRKNIGSTWISPSRIGGRIKMTPVPSGISTSRRGR